MSENNIVYRTKLSEMERHNKSYEDLSEKILRRSMGTLIETVPSLLQWQRDEDHSVIITAAVSWYNVDDIKKDIEKLCKSGSAPIPGDVMTTKLGHIILKPKNRRDAGSNKGSSVISKAEQRNSLSKYTRVNWGEVSHSVHRIARRRWSC